jgi:hypothetical protein
MVLASLLAAAAVPALAPARARAADDATADARSHYEMGLKLFDAREHEQALIEFTRANEIKPRPAAVFMMAQCEYLLGRLKPARAHYQAYVTEVPDGEFAGLARDRIESIDKRPSTFAINTVPDDVTIRISPEADAGTVVASGQAPNNFSIPRGRYRVDVTKPNYQGQTRIVDVDIAEVKPLFFKLEPIPARLEIETHPRGATLYVNGNRAQNPYRQDIPPGHVEIFAEAPDYEPRTTDLNLAPGEHRLLVGDNKLRLPYRQRSGRPELMVASVIMGGLVGGGAVAAAIGAPFEDPSVSSVLLVTGGAIAGGILGALVATPIVPDYIPDNRAFFIIGGMWIGGTEGAALGVIYQQLATYHSAAQPPCPGRGPCRGPLGDMLRAGFIGSLPGWAAGITGGALLARKHAPTYGRVALIQSGALGGAIVGALTQVAVQWRPYGEGWGYTVRVVANPTMAPLPQFVPGGVTTGNTPCPYDYSNVNMNSTCAFKETSLLDLMPGMLIGLNVGLAAGLLGAYLPDQRNYGPSWKRVVLVDLAAGAGMIAGATFGCVANPNCLKQAQVQDSRDRAIVAGAALGGGALGLIGGVLLTRHVDDAVPDTAVRASATMPIATFAPMRDAAGNISPALAAIGTF